MLVWWSQPSRPVFHHAHSPSTPTLTLTLTFHDHTDCLRLCQRKHSHVIPTLTPHAHTEVPRPQSHLMNKFTPFTLSHSTHPEYRTLALRPHSLSIPTFRPTPTNTTLTLHAHTHASWSHPGPHPTLRSRPSHQPTSTHWQVYEAWLAVYQGSR